MCLAMESSDADMQVESSTNQYQVEPNSVPWSVVVAVNTLLEMGCYYSTTTCHYWDMSVK